MRPYSALQLLTRAQLDANATFISGATTTKLSSLILMELLPSTFLLPSFIICVQTLNGFGQGRMCSGIFFPSSDKIGLKVVLPNCSQRSRTTGIVSCICRLAQSAKHILRANIFGLSNKEIFLFLMDLYYSILLVS